MKRIVLSIIVCLISPAMCASSFAGGERLRVPRIAYIEPNNDSTVDLAGKKTLTFRWKDQPVPSGGRAKIKFKVFKGFSYDLVVKEELGRDVFSIDILADKFEDGALYSWQVQQRDAGNMLWSLADTWSFKVKKK